MHIVVVERSRLGLLYAFRYADILSLLSDRVRTPRSSPLLRGRFQALTLMRNGRRVRGVYRFNDIPWPEKADPVRALAMIGILG
jgi:hypothetical protein